MIVTSPDIVSIDFEVLFDLSGVKPTIKLTNLSAGTGLTNCDWWYEVKTPSNTYIHQGNVNAPDVVGDNWGILNMLNNANEWPQPFGQIEWSGVPYVTSLFVKDSNGDIFSLSKETMISRPRGLETGAKSNFGAASIMLEVKCDTGKIYVEDTTGYSYNGITGAPSARKYTLVYPPDDTQVTPAPYVIDNFSSALLPITFSAPCYQIVYSSTMLYTYGNGSSVKIKYKYRKQFEVACDVDLCPLICDYNNLLKEAESPNCSDKAGLDFKIQQITGLLTQAIIGKMQPLCGINVAEKVAKIKEIGGFTCNCSFSGAGIGATSNSNNSLVFTFDTCGDIIASATVNGSNILLHIKDTKYVVKMCDTSDLLDAFTINSSYDSSTCTRTFCLNVNASKLPGSAAPEYVDVIQKGTSSTPPVGCPGPYFPVDVWSPGGTNKLGTAADVNGLVAILKADNATGGWATKGTWAPASYCSMLLYRATGITGAIPKIPVSTVATAPGGCVNNQQSYLVNPTEYCGGADVTVLAYPLEAYVRYTNGGPKTHLSLVTSYTDLLAKLNGASGKPGHISYVADPANSQLKVMVVDTDCSANKTVYLQVDMAAEIYFGAAFNGTPFSTAQQGIVSGMTMLEARTNTQKLSFVCNTKNEWVPWHTVKVGNFLYVVETHHALLRKIDISNPLFPIQVGTVAITAPAGVVNTPFFGLPKYNGTVDSHWDVYFPTDLNSQVNGFLYFMEGSSGSIWKYDIAANAIVASEYDIRLVGKCPRILVGNTLYFTQDGGREAAMGLASGMDPRRIHKLDVTTVGTGTLTIASSSQIVLTGDQIWAASLDVLTGNIWLTSAKGDLIYYDPVLPATSLFADIWGTAGVAMTGLANTHVFGTKIYLSSTNLGTKYIDLSPGLGGLTPAVSFQPALMTDGTTNTTHYNFVTLPGKCYGIVTLDRGATPVQKRGSAAKFTLDGQYLGVIDFTTAGNIYNLVPVGNIPSAAANGLCP